MLCTSFSVMAVCRCDFVPQINRDNCTKIGLVLCDFPTWIRPCFVVILSFDWGHDSPLDLSLGKTPTATCRVNLCEQIQADSAWDKAKKMYAHNVFYTDETNPNKPSVCTFYRCVCKVTLTSSAVFQLGIDTYLLSSRELGEKMSVQKIWGRSLSHLMPNALWVIHSVSPLINLGIERRSREACCLKCHWKGFLNCLWNNEKFRNSCIMLKKKENLKWINGVFAYFIFSTKVNVVLLGLLIYDDWQENFLMSLEQMDRSSHPLSSHDPVDLIGNSYKMPPY